MQAWEILGISSPKAAGYRNLLTRLVAYPQSDNGFDIGTDIPLQPAGHRHYSHLFMVYPLSTMNLSDADNYALAARSVDWWCGRPQRSHYEVAASMSTLLSDMSPLLYDAGRRRAVVTNISYNFENRLTPNTFYYEGVLLACVARAALLLPARLIPNGDHAGYTGRCGESAPGTATAIQDMMLTWAQGRVSVFAGLDDSTLASARFYNLLATDGVAVTARRENGTTLFVQLEAGAQATSLSMRVQGMAAPWVVDPPSVRVAMNGVDTATVTLAPGDVVVLRGAGVPDSALVVTEVPQLASDDNYWGKQKVAPTPPPGGLTCGSYGAVPGFNCNNFSCWSGSSLTDCGDSLAEPSLTCDPARDLPGCATEAAG